MCCILRSLQVTASRVSRSRVPRRQRRKLCSDAKKATFAGSPPSFGSELPVSDKNNASSVGKIVVCGEHRVSDLELIVPD